MHCLTLVAFVAVYNLFWLLTLLVCFILARLFDLSCFHFNLFQKDAICHKEAQ